MSTVIQFIVEKFYYLFLGFLGGYVILRMRYRRSDKKRRVLFILAIGVFFVFTGSTLIMEKILPEKTLYLFIAAAIAGEYFFLKKFWHFQMNCIQCGKRMAWEQVFTDDKNFCKECLDAEAPPEE